MIIPDYNIHDTSYYSDVDDKGLSHSYPSTPPGYSTPQILYSFHYEGIVTRIAGYQNYTWTWTVEPPFYILSGQGTSSITCELLPNLNKNQEQMKYGPRKLSYRDYKFSELNLTVSRWKETLNLYYKQGPLWKIEGNKSPLVKSVETYTLIPQYDQTGYPPKNTTNPINYSFNIQNGTVVKFYGKNPPNGNPIVDILWHTKGPAYISFYSAWTNEKVKFPNTLGIYVS